jgi:translation initiation factor IF-1
MKAILSVWALAVLLVVTSPCFALWGIAPVTREEAKGLGVEVRSKAAAGFNAVEVELEVKTDGKLKGFDRVDLRVGEGDKVVVAPLQEDRSKKGRVVVRFTADRTKLDKIRVWVMVPGLDGGTAYEMRVKDFVAPEKGR